MSSVENFIRVRKSRTVSPGLRAAFLDVEMVARDLLLPVELVEVDDDIALVIGPMRPGGPPKALSGALVRFVAAGIDEVRRG